MAKLEAPNRSGLRKAVFEDGRSLRRIMKEAGLSYNCGLKLLNKEDQRWITPRTADALSRVLGVERERLVL